MSIDDEDNGSNEHNANELLNDHLLLDNSFESMKIDNYFSENENISENLSEDNDDLKQIIQAMRGDEKENEKQKTNYDKQIKDLEPDFCTWFPFFDPSETS